MNKFIANLKVSRKLFMLFSVMLALTFVSIVASVIGFVELRTEVTDFFNSEYMARGYANNVLRCFERVQKFTFLSIAETDDDKANSYVESAGETATESLEFFAKLKEVYKGDYDIDRIEAEINEVTPVRQVVVELVKKHEYAEALNVVDNEWIPLLTITIESLNELIADIATSGDGVIKKMQSLIFTLVILMIIFLILSIFIGIYINQKIKNAILQPVEQIKHAANELAEGNFDFELSYESTDEFGEVVDALKTTVANQKMYVKDLLTGISSVAAKNLNTNSGVEMKGDFIPLRDGLTTTILSLNDTMETLQGSAGQVSQGSEQLAETSHSLAEGTTEQAGAVEELLATINDVTEQVNQNAKSTTQASQKAQKVNEGAEESSEKMSEMVQAMSRISETSKQIELIIQSIENIASQTNLLSLNAAIEAARAGEAGKGFAVVAGEISELANQSAQAAANTRQLISDSITEVENGNKIAASTAEALDNVRNGIVDIKNVTDEVMEASESQANAMEQINQGVEQISSVVQNNAALAEEVSATSEELSAQSVSLNGLAEEFTLRDKNDGSRRIVKTDTLAEEENESRME